ncbi:MAG TPA: MFS transporter [Allosphingosinicella sp.]|nr:MFS transporter [Allosphingosinicella sp.]
MSAPPVPPADIPPAHAFPSAGRAWYAVILIAAVSMMSNIDRGVINLVVGPIKESFALSDTSVGLLVGAAFSIFYFAFALPMARLADRYSRKAILLGGLTVWSVATSLCGLAQSYWQLFAFRAVVGAGESVKGPCSMSMISDLVPRSRLPRAFAIYNFGIAAGMSGALIIGGLLLKWFGDSPPVHLPFGIVIEGWHKVFLICGIPGLLLALLMAFTVKEPIRQGKLRPDQPSIAEVARYFGANARLYVPLLLASAIEAIEVFGFMTWRPAFFERTYGWPPEVTGPLLGSVMLAATPIGLILGTILVERMDKRGGSDTLVRFCLIARCIALPLSIATYLMPTPWLALGLTMACLISLSMAYPAQGAAIQIVTPNEMRAQVSAVFLFSVSVIGGGFGPAAIGLITDQIFQDESMLRYSMLLFAALMEPVGLFLIWIAMSAYGRRVREIDSAAGGSPNSLPASGRG